MKLKKGWAEKWFAAGTFTLILLAVYLIVSTGKTFQVVYTQEHQNEGWEKIPAGIQIYASAALTWAGVSAILKTAGWIAMALVLPGTLLAYKFDAELSVEKGTPWLKNSLVFGPILACAILWLASYSSRLDLGAYTGKFDDFKTEFKISDELAAKIQKEGGTGTLHIKDENGLITEYFKKRRGLK